MPMTVRMPMLCRMLRVKRSSSSFVALLAACSCLVPAACASSSSGGSSTLVTGTYAAESGGSGPIAAATGDCGTNPEFDIDARNVVRVYPRYGVSLETTPVAALQAALTHGSEPIFGGSSGDGLVRMGYPAAGWTEVAASSGSATFQAPLHSGTARLVLSRVGNKWLVSHGQKNC